MKKKRIFKGCATALITPFCDGDIDYDALRSIIEFQISEGIDALVIGGTTGEAACLSDDERYKLYEKAKEFIDGRVPLIFGTGTNDTRAALCHARRASQIGCDGILVVTPYYNKGTKDGVISHYLNIAEASSVPLILYNVPSRTGVCLDIPTVKRLSRHENIVAIKEASDSVDRLSALSSLSDKLTLYAGNDNQIFQVLSLGGEGVISVVSNLYPRQTSDICKLFFANEHSKSLKLQHSMLDVMSAMFTETNPSPVKYAMTLKGYCKGQMRLPMAPPSISSKKIIESAIEQFESTK